MNKVKAIVDARAAYRAGFIVKDLVYGDIFGSLLLLTKTRADELLQIREALVSARTWGEFAELVVPRTMAAIEKRYGELPSAVPPWQFLLGREPFPLLAEDKIEQLPGDLLELGEIRPDREAGDRLAVPSAAEPELLKRLRAHNCKFTRDDELVRSTCDDKEPIEELRAVLQAKTKNTPKEGVNLCAVAQWIAAPDNLTVLGTFPDAVLARIAALSYAGQKLVLIDSRGNGVGLPLLPPLSAEEQHEVGSDP